MLQSKLDKELHESFKPSAPAEPAVIPSSEQGSHLVSWTRQRHGLRSGEGDVLRAAPVRGRLSSVDGVRYVVAEPGKAQAVLGGKERAEQEAEAFARLTASARDPKAEARKRLARKHAEDAAYERASSEGEIWKNINDAVSHAESHTVTVKRGIEGEVSLLRRMDPADAAKELAKLSQQEGTVVLGALRSIEPKQVTRILAALAGQSGGTPPPPGTAGAGGAPPNASSAAALPPPQFDIHSVMRFAPGESLSFAKAGADTFSLSYADDSVISGYVGRDIVQLGHFYAMTRFGCALDTNDPRLNGIDGILGMGMPDAALPQIPTPLVFALANDKGGLEGANYINEHPLRARKFAFLATKDSAELQLGGYDRASTNADMVYVPTTSTTEYSVNVQSLTFGGIELLDWVDKSRPNAVPAIMDTGTTCLVIPDTLIEGRVNDRPYSKFKSIMTKGMSFYITIDGHLFEIPFEAWWQARDDAPCVQRAPPSYAGLLLGDVVFQSLVVEFDLTKPKHPRIGIAPRNPLYRPVAPGEDDTLKLPVIRRSHGGVKVFDPHERDSRHGIDHVPVAMDGGRTQFMVNVSVGSPRQPFQVLIDTGSSCLAIFAKLPRAQGSLETDSGESRRLRAARERLLAKSGALNAVARGDAEAHRAAELRRARQHRALEQRLSAVGVDVARGSGVAPSSDESFEMRFAEGFRRRAMQEAGRADRLRGSAMAELTVLKHGPAAGAHGRSELLLQTDARAEEAEGRAAPPAAVAPWAAGAAALLLAAGVLPQLARGRRAGA